MKITTIQISVELRKKLNELKYYYGDKTIEDVIKRHINFISLEKQNDTNNKKSNQEMEDKKSLS